MPARIEDYALLGDCQTAALVARDGSIDWLCLPRFDSAACFAALLGTPEHGRWLLAPAVPVRQVRRRYRPGTLVLETEFETDDGAAAVIDFMPLRAENPHLIRIVEGCRRQVAMRLELAARFDFGAIVPWVRPVERGIEAIAGPDRLRLRTPIPLRDDDGARTTAEFLVSEGQRVPFDLTWQPSYRTEPPESDPEQSLRDTERWWREWSGHGTYQGPWGEAVRRSLITLKALTYAPTGGIVAAPTTSLPVRLGGTRNWDYRYCWLRDATFTLLTLLDAGYREEAVAWREWLLRSVAGRPAQMNIMYSITGKRRLTELELPWLPGYEGARPVRIGNAAHAQLQLDVYGEVMDVMHQCLKAGMGSGGDGWRIERAVLEFLESNWDQPDVGLWELRIQHRHFTHSKMMAWVAFDRAVKAIERFGLDGPVDRWRALRDEVHEQVCREGFDPELNAFVQSYGSKRLDASLLMMPLVGFLPAEDPRVRGTVEAIERYLTIDGWVTRYAPMPEAHPLSPGESAFLLCNFWLVDNLHLLGRYADARRLFERLLGLCNDVGLLSEGYDPDAGRLVGNFPQAFSHVGLVDTAFNLSRGAGGPAEQRPHS